MTDSSALDKRLLRARPCMKASLYQKYAAFFSW